MRCKDDCHKYELENFMSVFFVPEILNFYRMDPDGTKSPGTTNEEVLRALIHRLTYLNDTWMDGKFHCLENSIAIDDLKHALEWLDRRTADRVKRGVKATQEK